MESNPANELDLSKSNLRKGVVSSMTLSNMTVY
jgi:hypothetical protein